MSANTWAMVCHLAGLLNYVIPFAGGVIGPLVVWIIKKDEMPEVDYHGKEAVNFNLSLLIYGGILWALSFVTFGLGLFAAIPIFGLLLVLHIVCTIAAALRANAGQPFRYPLTMRIVT